MPRKQQTTDFPTDGLPVPTDFTQTAIDGDPALSCRSWHIVQNVSGWDVLDDDYAYVVATGLKHDAARRICAVLNLSQYLPINALEELLGRVERPLYLGDFR